jgi:hypothetical protein
MNESINGGTDGGRPGFREIITNAIRYWEIRRFVYNGVLALIVLAHFAAAADAVRDRAMRDANLVLGLFVLAVLANLCYCAAYVADVIAQFSGFRDVWLKGRVGLLVLGVAFAGVLTHFFSLGLFSGPGM